MDAVESDRERPPRPLASLGNDSHFLDAILGEILQPQLHDAMAREREWGRRRGTPSAPPLEVDVLDFGVFDFPEISPIGAAVSELETAPLEEISSGSARPDDSPNSARLPELTTSPADDMDHSPLGTQDGVPWASDEPDDSPSSAHLLELVSTLADNLSPPPSTLNEEVSWVGAEGSPSSEHLLQLVTTLADNLSPPPPTLQEEASCVGAKESPSSARLLELVTTLADTLTPLQPAPCEMTRCDSWEFSSLRVPTDPAIASRSASTCSSFDSLSRALHGLSAGRASMCLPRSRAPPLPPRPRSASPTLPQHHAAPDTASTTSTSNFTSSDEDADSHYTEALEESEHLG